MKTESLVLTSDDWNMKWLFVIQKPSRKQPSAIKSDVLFDIRNDRQTGFSRMNIPAIWFLRQDIFYLNVAYNFLARS